MYVKFRQILDVKDLRYFIMHPKDSIKSWKPQTECVSVGRL